MRVLSGHSRCRPWRRRQHAPMGACGESYRQAGRASPMSRGSGRPRKMALRRARDRHPQTISGTPSPPMEIVEMPDVDIESARYGPAKMKWREFWQGRLRTVACHQALRRLSLRLDPPGSTQSRGYRSSKHEPRPRSIQAMSPSFTVIPGAFARQTFTERWRTARPGWRRPGFFETSTNRACACDRRRPIMEAA